LNNSRNGYSSILMFIIISFYFMFKLWVLSTHTKRSAGAREHLGTADSVTLQIAIIIQ